MIQYVQEAPAKINLTLRILGRRADGFHNLASVVAFADKGDELALTKGDSLSLTVSGPFAAAAGPDDSNLVLRAARLLKERIPELKTGHFKLTKNLPAGAGVGGVL
jgi:4-diphosphocytidyl-2-C-methyl-D-erythritol kinase